jgi:hypothetical protein
VEGHIAFRDFLARIQLSNSSRERDSGQHTDGRYFEGKQTR